MIRPFPVREEAAAEEAAEEGEAAASPEAEEATPSDFRKALFRSVPEQNCKRSGEFSRSVFSGFFHSWPLRLYAAAPRFRTFSACLLTDVVSLGSKQLYEWSIFYG